MFRAMPLLTLPLLVGSPALAGGGEGEPGLAPGAAEVAEQQAEETAPTDLRSALLGGDWWIKLRLRYEDVDQDGFDKDAHALTLRTVLGYETGAWHGLSAGLEFEDVSAIGGDDTYDSTVNGNDDRPVIADPDSTEINQVFLRYRYEDVLDAHLGRQYIILDNSRFIGDVVWRQNQQTFDAASAAFDLPLSLDGFYAYVANVDRINSELSPVGDAPMDSHLIHMERSFEGWGTLSVYDYFLDFEDADFHYGSTNSLGARFAGRHGLGERLDLLYGAELAHQTDVGDNPEDVSATYRLLELGAKVGIVTGKVGWEVLGGDGNAAFQTPLATLHAFNGWADKFLVTPDDGLEDLFLLLGVKVGKGNLSAIYHDFRADEGGAEYGSEIDLLFTWPVTQELTFGVKYADYSADDFATDTRKAWAWLEASF
jgi:hypothetical protein